MEEQQKETQQQEQTPKEPPILEQIREYAETRIKLSKYKVIEKSTGVIASLVTTIATVVCLLLTFLFASFTLALFLADVFHSYWKGFGAVALLYLIIAVIVMSAKDSFRKPLVNALIKKIFSENK
ncbi:phage holin family protein [Mucilaginibacter sp. RS28]|uniref:Phage holin family protein n=1 Tax=Mucilaginibacter straminoryzae TaxID=2932774 RepID=A0A9X1X3K2_9SPHI|nr:phage holin family protein [Mucilaginibacter straminoryzae]MCJ8210489.1 phage holin family protein [Mucilaginibacter straminoryzae]